MLIPRLVGLLVAFVLATLGACSRAPDGPQAFVATDDDIAIIVTLTQSPDGQLTGTWQQAQIAQERTGEPLKAYNTAVSGRVDGNAVTLTVGGELGALFGSTFTGTLDGDSLKLNVPQENGQQQVMTLTKSTSSEYNDAVARLRTKAEDARAAADSQDAAAAAAAAQAQADAELDQAQADLHTALEALEADATELRNGIGGLRTAAAGVATALTAQQSVARKARQASCDDLASVQSDEAGAYSDLAGRESDYAGEVSTHEGALGDVEAGLEAVQKLVDQLKAGGATVPDLAAVRAAKSAITTAGDAKKMTDAQVRGLVAEAERVDAATQDLTC